jgi:hypothetical protein
LEARLSREAPNFVSVLFGSPDVRGFLTGIIVIMTPGIPSANTVTWCAVSGQILPPSKFRHYGWFEGLGINDERQGKLGGIYFKWAAELSVSVRVHELNNSGRSPNGAKIPNMSYSTTILSTI